MSIAALPSRSSDPDKQISRILRQDGEHLRTHFVSDILNNIDKPSVSPEALEKLLHKYLIGTPDLPHEKATMHADVEASTGTNEIHVANVFTFHMPTGKSKYVLDFFYIPLMALADVPGVPAPEVTCDDDGRLTFVYRTSRYADETIDESMFEKDVTALCGDHWARIQFAVELLKQDIETVEKRDSTLLGLIDVQKERWRRAKAAVAIAENLKYRTR
jgi:hypothetical protein